MAKCVACAAMGLSTDVDEQATKAKNMAYEYQGKTYYFDSQEHLNMFKEDPDRYLKIAKEKGWAA